jgi:hypothetical protein
MLTDARIVKTGVHRCMLMSSFQGRGGSVDLQTRRWVAAGLLVTAGGITALVAARSVMPRVMRKMMRSMMKEMMEGDDGFKPPGP